MSPRRIIAIMMMAVVATSCDSGGKKGGRQGKGGRFGGPGFTGEPPPPEVQITKSQIPVQTNTIKNEYVANVYRSSAVLQPEHDIQVQLTHGDTVKEVAKHTGAAVAKGDVIATLESSTLNLALRKARIALAEKKRVFVASKQLFEQKHISFDSFEQARIEYENAKIAVDENREKVAKMTIRSPVDGVVARNDLKTHATRASYGNEFPIRIVTTAKLQGELALPALHRKKVGIGLKVTLRARGKSVVAEMVRVAPVVDNQTGTFATFFELVDSQEFVPGERVSVEVPLGEAEQRLILPDNAVVFEGNRPYVYIPGDPTEEEIIKELKRFEKKDGEAGENGERSGKARGTAVAKGEGGQASKRSEDTGSDEKGPDGKRDKPEVDLKKLLAEIPRARRIAVEIEQLPNGRYALREGQQGEAKQLGEGTAVIVVGLLQLADSAKLKIVDAL